MTIINVMMLIIIIVLMLKIVKTCKSSGASAPCPASRPLKFEMRDQGIILKNILSCTN